MNNSKESKVQRLRTGMHNFLELAESKKNQTSIEDTSRRRFSITIYLEDPIARTPYVQIQYDNDISFHTKKEDGGAIDFWFQKNSNDLLESILVGTEERTVADAFNAINSIYPTLSIISFKYKLPINILNIQVDDLTHEASWGMPQVKAKPVRMNSIPAGGFFTHTSFGSLFALYREAVSCINETHRFLTFYKILEAYQKGKSPFDTKEKRDRLIVRREMLEAYYIPEYHGKFADRTFADCINELRKLRDFLAHPYKDKGNKYNPEFINIDHPNHLAEIGASALLLEVMASMVLNSEMKAQAKHDEELKKLIENFDDM